MGNKEINCQYPLKAFHTAIAPYFADTYNTLNSVVQGVSLGALFYIFTTDEFQLTIAVILKVFIAFLLICIIWHRYITHTQFIAWELRFYDTFIPMSFAIGQLCLILTIPQNNIFNFSLFFSIVVVLGLLAYINATRQFKGTEMKDLLSEHFADKEFAEIFYQELYTFEKKAIRHMIVTVASCAVITIFNYYVVSLSDDLKLYCTSVVFIVMLFFFIWKDLRQHLIKSSKLQKYRSRW